MREKDRKICFVLNSAALFFIFILVYLSYKLTLYLPQPDGSSPSYARYYLMLASALLCALLLQSEEIFQIVRRRRSVIIRWELMLLGIVTLLIVFIKFGCLLAYRSEIFNLMGGTELNWFTAFLAVCYGENIDIIFMFAAVILFVHAFHIQDGLLEKKRRKNYFILYILLILFIFVISYCDVWFFQSGFKRMNWFIYVLNFLNVFEIFIYAIVLQAEKLLSVIRMEKVFFVRREMVVLGIAAVLLAILQFWSALLLNGVDSEILQSINTSNMWQIACMFAAGIFFARAYKTEVKQL